MTEGRGLKGGLREPSKTPRKSDREPTERSRAVVTGKGTRTRLEEGRVVRRDRDQVKRGFDGID